MSAILFSPWAAGGNPFLRLEKSAVLQETRIFNDNVINSRKCATVLTKVLCILNQVQKKRSIARSIFPGYLSRASL